MLKQRHDSATSSYRKCAALLAHLAVTSGGGQWALCFCMLTQLAGCRSARPTENEIKVKQFTSQNIKNSPPLNGKRFKM